MVAVIIWLVYLCKGGVSGGAGVGSVEDAENLVYATDRNTLMREARA